jgi:membrane-bound lytic murein transglycosylase B
MSIRVKNHVVAAAVGVAVLLALPGGMDTPARRLGEPPFDTWRAAFIEEAVSRGLERQFVAEALGALEPLPRVLELDRAQAEAPSDLELYLADRVTPELIAQGREMLRRHGRLLKQIERAYGVQRKFLVAIWGAETGYGRFTGDVPVLQALATLAWQRRRSAYFRGELLAALQILGSGDVDPHVMLGSWAGAMGQPQFMPTSYLKYAIDLDRDGRRDIWTSAADTLGSIANYLRRFGWADGGDWGVEVVMAPTARSRIEREIETRSSGCGAVRVLTERRPVHEWFARGVRVIAADAPREVAEASLVTLGTRTFLVYGNYETILAYNCSHRYALSVSMLADRLE